MYDTSLIGAVPPPRARQSDCTREERCTLPHSSRAGTGGAMFAPLAAAPTVALSSCRDAGLRFQPQHETRVLVRGGQGLARRRRRRLPPTLDRRSKGTGVAAAACPEVDTHTHHCLEARLTSFHSPPRPPVYPSAPQRPRQIQSFVIFHFFICSPPEIRSTRH